MNDVVRVVIADDHEAVRSGVAAILETDPTIAVVAQAEDGFSALTACLDHRPAVALVDMRMPGKDGVWATERITAETSTRVLVLTTYDSDDLIAQALAAGAHGYLLKTTKGSDLISAVHHVAADRHVLDPAITGGLIARVAASATNGNDVSSASGLDRTQLTQRERDVLDLLAEGRTNQQIADALGVGVTTVKTHVGSLYAKSGATSRVQLAQLGAPQGW